MRSGSPVVRDAEGEPGSDEGPSVGRGGQRVVVIGIQQMIFGAVVIAATAIHLARTTPQHQRRQPDHVLYRSEHHTG